MSYSAALPPGMFWHIFRKDWRLLSALVITNAALRALLSVVTFHSEPYPLPDRVSALGAFVTLALLVTMCLVIALSVQQEALPGVSQDWLVRPIKRRDLLTAKLLVIAVFIHGPNFTVDLLQGLAEGFSLWPVLRATLLGNLEIALVFSLPVMAVAALTRSIGEAVVGALAVFVGLLGAWLLILGLIFSFNHTFEFSGPVSGTGVAWIWRLLSHAVLLLTLIGTLTLQYFRRDTLRSRWLFVAGLFLFMVAHDLPWDPAFAIQQGFSANPQAAQGVSVSFDPQARERTAALAGASSLLSTEDTSEKHDKRTTVVILPMRVAGLRDGMLLHTDRGVVRLIDESGRSLYRGVTQPIDVQASLTGDGQVLVGQPIGIPTPIYRNLASHALRVELDYSLTLLRSRTLPPLAATDEHQRNPDLGRCGTRSDATGSAIEVGCRKAGELPSCVSLVLEAGERRNPEKFVCDLNYEPALLRFSVGPVDHVHVKLPYRDPTGLARFPVNESALSDAHVAIRAYEPEDHFTRHIVIQQLQLSDWRASAAP